MKQNYSFKFLLLIFISVAFGEAMGQSPIFTPGMNISTTGSVNSPNGEDVSKIIDANNYTKFLDFNYSDGMGFTVFMGGAAYVATSIEITTANDSPNRDPRNFQISGSNDGSAFTSVASGSIPCISSRFTKRSFSFSNTNAYKYYRIIFTTQCGPDNSLQIAETQLLGTKVNQAPVAVCKAFTAQLDSSGNVTISPNDVDGGSSDDKTGFILSIDQETFDCSNIGENTVELTITDSDGVKDTCTTTVTVEDNIAPIVNTQDVSLVLDENGKASISGDYTVGPVAGQLEPQNSLSTTTTVDCDCPEGYVTVGYEGSSGWILDDFRLMCKEVLADGSLGTEIIETCFSGSQTSLGNTKVLNGNEILVGFQVIDGDYQYQQSSRTHVSIQGYAKSLNEVARGSLNDIENTVLGAISGSGTATSNLNTTTKFAPAGQAIVGMSVNQTSGYSSSVSFKYAPINALLSINNASSDNCEIASISADVYDFTCEDIGANTVTLTVTDINGNESSSTAIVTVEDNTAPTAIAKDITVQLDEYGMASITPEMIDFGSSDNCTDPDALSFSLDKTEFNCENIESNNPSAIDFSTENNSYFSTDATANIPIGAQERTISLWVNPDVSKFCWGCLIQQGNGDCTSKMFGLGMSENNKLVFWGGCDDYISNLSIPNDTWTYIAVTFKNGLVTLYANGESESFSKPNINTTSSKLFVGRETVNNGASFRSNFDGQIDEIRIYNRALKELEVEEDKASQAPLNGVVSNYTFDDTNGTDIDDEEGNNNGTLFGSNGDNFVEGITKQTQVTLTVTDQNGNSSVATAIVTVEDNIAAEVLTQNITVQLDELGMASITPEMIDNGSNDACGIESLILDVTDFTCENIGENTVTLTATDVNGNESSATAVVTVEDNIAAEVLTQNITVQLDELGMTSITPEMIDNGSNDACGIESLGLDVTDFTCENIGGNTVTLTATDVNGNESSATSVVTVEDNIATEVLTQNITVQLDEMGMTSITPEMIDNGSNDACGIASLSLDVTDFTCEDVGENTLTLTAIDVNGNESSATTVVTVEDNIAAEVLTQNITVQLDEMGMTSITPAMIDNGSNDACGIESLILDVTDFTCEDVGENTLTLTATDVNGNESSATAIVTVEDNIAAEVLTQNITVQLDEMGMTSITPEMIDNGSNDACGIASLSLDVTDFTCEDVGESTLTLTVVDDSGNESSATAVVTIQDVTAPMPVMDVLDVVYAECIIEETDLVKPLAIDNCDTEIVAVADVAFPITAQGTTIITWKYKDASGNIAYQQQKLIIEDTTAPVPDITELETITVDCNVANISAPTATDDCKGTIVGTSSDELEYSTQGNYMITWVFDDGNGNIATQEQQVIVNDITAPIVSTKDITVVLDPEENVSISVEDINDGSYDECGEVSLSLDQDTFTEPGVYEVILTVTDTNGNTAQAMAQVDVITNHPETLEAHVVPTILKQSTSAKVIVPFRTKIVEIQILESETGKYKIIKGNQSNEQEIEVAPFKGTLLVRIIDQEGNVYLKKLIAL
ncbi:LamG-like jellyroll fold domain-containing protein [Salegentibacter flavus]|uniref:Concanavalin A-like lectin/glucanases superfamily protein n=1 Tax=Salegentibacter flavus TaxID=287099 RepID=A0A1I5B642_9FLAO|nr:LamG-like jellyroll fold domain-containing protein [Salegentibacter flavus]SFN70175.1 Concanavalin A-like lectin/glucanases superfamily protein [Salegentibacter flavus]